MPFFSLFLLGLISFLLTVGTSFLVLYTFPSLGLLDRPERYGHSRAPIPYPGGVALVTVVLGVMGFCLEWTPLVMAVLWASALLALVCFWDDRYGLSPYFRFGVQILVALILVFGGLGVHTITNPFGAPLSLDAVMIPLSFGEWSFNLSLFSALLTMGWVIAMVNAFNWIDGVPGMASSMSAVTAFILLLLSVRPDFHYVDQTLSISLSTILLAASVSFLFFNFPKPRMLMGDTGSMFLGLLLAVTALISGGKVATTALVLGFPLVDFVWVILRRVFKGQSPFKGDLWHFHHRLQKAGYQDRTIVILFTLASLVFGLLALLLHTEGKLFALAGIVGLMAFLAFLLYGKE